MWKQDRDPPTFLWWQGTCKGTEGACSVQAFRIRKNGTTPAGGSTVTLPLLSISFFVAATQTDVGPAIPACIGFQDFSGFEFEAPVLQGQCQPRSQNQPHRRMRTARGQAIWACFAKLRPAGTVRLWFGFEKYSLAHFNLGHRRQAQGFQGLAGYF